MTRTQLAAILLLSLLVIEVAARGRGGRRSRGSARRGQKNKGPSAEGILLGVAICIACLAVIGCWCFSLTYEPTISSLRKVMVTLFCAMVAAEYCLYRARLLRGWAVPAVVVADLWGALDAIVRFPHAREVESIFGVKQSLLLVLKFCCCLFALRDHRKYFIYLFGYTVACVLTLPLLYLIALPIDDSDRKDLDLASLDVADEDILKRILKFFFSSKSRAESLKALKAFRSRSDHLAVSVGSATL
eukprot:NODE_1295_length_1182_cov_307.449867.p1 GENE.NODE_1295_length_1182_cov_307.449867~~NODE_1295_length_1182_cov_307.449867.p1  ORF type:complete len:245 (+),score=52.96 NODE_1295_length_1182_cov_307.449867:156-890(+)